MSVLNKLKQKFLDRIVSSHLAGPAISDAIRLHDQAVGLGWSSTFGYWGGPDDTPSTTAKAYLDALAAIRSKNLSSYISIKLPGINFDTGLLREVLETAKPAGIRVHLDSLAPEDADRTFSILEEYAPKYPGLSITIPSRWKRSSADAERAISYRIPVRIVKGQWYDPAFPKLDARKNYLAVINVLAGKAAHVAVATHEPRLASEALRRLRQEGTSCEMEQMSSLPINCARVAKQQGVPMRVYIPYGFPSLPYSLRNAPARPAIVGWVVRDFILGSRKNLSGA